MQGLQSMPKAEKETPKWKAKQENSDKKYSAEIVDIRWRIVPHIDFKKYRIAIICQNSKIWKKMPCAIIC